jgi:tripartite-type tricarboxylate transporter receptor subunit TctC
MKILPRKISNAAPIVFAIVIASSIPFPRDGAWSQARPIRIVVPYAPGGINETMSRLLADQIARTGGPSFLVESRPGAGTVLATDAVSRAAPDGSTVLIVSNSFVINPHVRKLAYDPLTSFEPICYLWQSPSVFAVNSASPYHTLADLLAAARMKPGELTMGASGPLTGFHIAFERLKQAANVNIAFVPFGGTVPAVNALLGGHVVSAFGDYSLFAEYFKTGTLRALATGLKTRTEALREIPTVEESGFHEYQADIWYGLVAPAKTPKEKIAQLTDWMTGAMHNPEIRTKLVAVGLEPVGVCGDQFGAHIRKQYEEYGGVIRLANFKPE